MAYRDIAPVNAFDNFLARGGSSVHRGQVSVPSWARQTAREPRFKPRANEKKTQIPGYTGYIRHSHAVAGRSYGRATRRALNKDIRQLLISDLLPTDPQSSTKLLRLNRPASAGGHVRPASASGTRDYGRLEPPSRYMPGYTGFVPFTKNQIGVTYGHAANESLTRRHVTRPQSAKEARRAINVASLYRVSHPLTVSKPRLRETDTLGGQGPRPGQSSKAWQ